VRRWLALRNITAQWRNPSTAWRAAMNQFAVIDDDRFTRPRVLP
jgi:putative transposase